MTAPQKPMAERRAFWRRVREAAAKVAAMPESQRVRIGYAYIPLPYELTREQIVAAVMGSPEPEGDR